MKLELKNTKSFRGMEGYGYNATLYADGVKTALVMEAGNGGEISYEVYNQEYFSKVETYAKTLPAVEYYGSKLSMDMDLLMGRLYDQIDITKKMKSLMSKKILIGIPGAFERGESIRTISFQKPLSSLPKDKLQEFISKTIPSLKPGEKILNTNLPGFKLD